MRADTVPWWKQAGADFEAAEFTLQNGRYFVAAWLAQQAAEKGLKAVYVERHGQLSPRTHALPRLGMQLNVPAPVQADLALLNPAFGVARYPDALGVAPVDAVGQTDATAYVDAARRVLAWIISQL
jgi:HEPN domain-containing protein